MILQDNYCGCPEAGSCTCQGNETSFFAYSGGGTFPMKKGSRGENVRALQVALNTKFRTPASLRIITPTNFWGDKTQALIEYHDLPSKIPNAQVLQAILEGKNPKKIISGLLYPHKSETGESHANTTWKNPLKDPNQALGLLGKFSQIIGSLRGKNQQQKDQNVDFRLGQQDFGAGGFQGNFQASGNSGDNQQQPKRLPTGAWIAIGLVSLLFLGFIVLKLSK